MLNKIKIIFLVSGNGGNLKFVCEYMKLYGNRYIEIIAVIADRNCGAIDYARSQAIPTHVIAYDKTSPENLHNLLERYSVDFLISNWNKIIDPYTVNSFKNKIINLHYSLLPAFSGMLGDNPIRKAIEKNCKYVGTTVHFVNENIDDGKIIGQTIIKIEEYNDFPSLMDKIFQDGAINLLNSIFFITNYLSHDQCGSSSSISISPQLCFDISRINNKFWKNLEVI